MLVSVAMSKHWDFHKIAINMSHALWRRHAITISSAHAQRFSILIRPAFFRSDAPIICFGSGAPVSFPFGCAHRSFRSDAPGAPRSDTPDVFPLGYAQLPSTRVRPLFFARARPSFCARRRNRFSIRKRPASFRLNAPIIFSFGCARRPFARMRPAFFHSDTPGVFR